MLNHHQFLDYELLLPPPVENCPGKVFSHTHDLAPQDRVHAKHLAICMLLADNYGINSKLLADGPVAAVRYICCGGLGMCANWLLGNRGLAIAARAGSYQIGSCLRDEFYRFHHRLQ